MIKAVIDTNIFISGLIGSGNPCLILNSLGNNDIKELASLIQSSARITSSPVKIQFCRDPKDNIVLECAIAGEADFIVTGDNDLLCLNSYRSIRIITPAHFLKILQAK